VKSAIEFHDSSVAAARLVAGILELSLSPAYIHRSLGTPGIDSGEGHLGEVVLELANATVIGNLDVVRGRNSDGALSVNGATYTVVPLPFASANSASLSLALESGATLEIRASSVQVASVGPTTYVEPFTG
jgi:hypothetical protein